MIYPFLFNPNPIVDQRNELAKSFNEIRINNYFEKIELFIASDQEKIEIQKLEYREDTKRPLSPIHDTKISLGNNKEGLLFALDRNVIETIYSELYSLKKIISMDKKVKRIPFPVELISKATDMLASTVYEGQPILIE
ncbi:MAG: hypothetical protein ACFFC3_01670 [Candidatus Odinarchaeota archaeon]